MADLETMYGEDAAQALYMWRFAGVSFGLEARFWWTLLGSLATASLTALGAILYKVIQERIEDHTWLTNELEYRERVRREDHDVAELMALIQRDCSVEIARREI